MQAFITKYALTQGILEVQDAVHHQGATDMISIPSMGSSAYFHGSMKEWYVLRSSAELRADEMRTRKIANLEQQIKKLKALTF